MLEIISPVTSKKIQVSDSDLRYKNLRNARLESEKIGDGWRLPTIEELEQVYNDLFLNGIGNITEMFYWSDTETNDRKAYGWGMSSGSKVENSIFFQGHVRLVRDID